MKSVVRLFLKLKCYCEAFSKLSPFQGSITTISQYITTIFHILILKTLIEFAFKLCLLWLFGVWFFYCIPRQPRIKLELLSSA